VKLRGTLFFAAGAVVALGLGWAGFPLALYERIPQPVNFSHKVHTGGEGGQKCEDCHALNENGAFAGIPALASCSTCHAQAMGETAAEKKFIADFVEKNREVPWATYSRQPDNVWFPHAPHVKLAKLSCERCHAKHGATDTLRAAYRDRITGYSRDVWQDMRMDDCIACHRQNKQSHSCLDCHK